MTAGAGFVTEEENPSKSTGTNPPAGITNTDQTKTKTKMKMNSDYIIGDDYRDPKHGCLAVIIAILCTVAMCLLFSGCKTTQPLTQTRDSVRVEFRHDSVYIYQKDSIFRDRWRAGDTVFVTVEKFKTLYKDKLVEVHDTISTTQTEQIAVKYVPNYYRRTSTGFWILLAVLIVLVGCKVAKIYFKIQSGGIL